MRISGGTEGSAFRQRRGLDVQIAALLRRAQIGERGAGAAAAPRRGLEEARAFLGGDIVALRPEIGSVAPESSGGPVRSAAVRSVAVGLVAEL